MVWGQIEHGVSGMHTGGSWVKHGRLVGNLHTLQAELGCRLD